MINRPRLGSVQGKVRTQVTNSDQTNGLAPKLRVGIRALRHVDAMNNSAHSGHLVSAIDRHVCGTVIDYTRGKHRECGSTMAVAKIRMSQL
jgi:hypothetical protein